MTEIQDKKYLKLSDHSSQVWGIWATLSALEGLASSRGLTVSPEPQQQSQLTEVGQLLCSQILSRTLKIGHREKNKHKLDLNPRYGPDPCMYPSIHTDRETDRQLSLGHFSLKMEFHKFWFLAKKFFHIFVVCGRGLFKH